MILQSDNVPEIDQIKPVIPEIMKFSDDIREMRQIQRGIFSMQFRRDDNEDDRPLFSLPQLPSRKQERTNYSNLDSNMESRITKQRLNLVSQESPSESTPNRQSLD